MNDIFSMQEYGPELSLAFGNRSAGKYTFDFFEEFYTYY